MLANSAPHLYRVERSLLRPADPRQGVLHPGVVALRRIDEQRIPSAFPAVSHRDVSVAIERLERVLEGQAVRRRPPLQSKLSHSQHRRVIVFEIHERPGGPIVLGRELLVVVDGMPARVVERLANEFQWCCGAGREDHAVLVGVGVEVTEDAVASLVDDVGGVTAARVQRVRVAVDVVAQVDRDGLDLRLRVEGRARVIQITQIWNRITWALWHLLHQAC